MNSTSQGWIKLHRKMESWEWYTDIPVKVLFLHLLLKANHAPAKWRGTTVARGELITSAAHLAEETGLSVQQVKTALKKLERTGEISRNATNEYTRIKCCNYSLYQAYDGEEQPTDNQPLTNGQPTDNQRVTTNKNNKNNNNKKNNKKRLQRECSFDIEALKRKAELNDDYDI